MCRRGPEVRFLWAHAGVYLGPEEVVALVASCGNVWTELAARDPWRYNGFADRDGRLSPAWMALFKRFPGRFMTGSDPVWPPGSRGCWDVADTGWDKIGQFLGYHRRWLRRLPAPLADRIRLGSAREFLGEPGPAGNLAWP